MRAIFLRAIFAALTFPASHSIYMVCVVFIPVLTAHTTIIDAGAQNDDFFMSLPLTPYSFYTHRECLLFPYDALQCRQ